jgi:hypothetical protein
MRTQVAHVIRSIGPEFAAYCEAIEREQIDGGVLTSLPFEDVASLLVCLVLSVSHLIT